MSTIVEDLVAIVCLTLFASAILLWAAIIGSIVL